MISNNNYYNPLLSYADVLLSVASKLKQQTTEPNLANLSTQLIDEMNCFERNIDTYGYPSNIIVAARYMLCALIDEIILASAWGKKSNWKEISLLTHFQYEYNDFSRFFVILERNMKQPKISIDLLELAYLILHLGFHANYSTTRDRDKLDQLIDNLYEMIKVERGSLKKNILQAQQTVLFKKKRRETLPPLWLTALVTVVILLAIYFPYYEAIKNRIKPIKESLHSIVMSQNKQPIAGQKNEIH